MTSDTSVHFLQLPHLDQILGYAVIQSWDELMPDPADGVIHIEYETGADGLLDFLKIWASAVRGQWKLVCALWIRQPQFHLPGLFVANNYHSADLARLLAFVTAHQDAFIKLPKRSGMIQIYPPNDQERKDAQHWVTEVFHHEGSVNAEQHVAA